MNSTNESASSKMKSQFPIQFKSLETAVDSGHVDRSVDEAARLVWQLCQTWLTFLDGDDFQLTCDRSIYDEYVRLANMNPRCSVEEESSIWLNMHALNAGRFLMGIAFDCGVERVVQVAKMLGANEELQLRARREIRVNADETMQVLLQRNLGSIGK